MPYILESARSLTKEHEKLYIRMDGSNGNSGWLQEPAHKHNCYRIIRVWSDGINARKHKSDPGTRPAFIPSTKLNQRVEVFSVEEFMKLPE